MEINKFVKTFDNVLSVPTCKKFLRVKDKFFIEEDGLVGGCNEKKPEIRKVSVHHTSGRDWKTKTEVHWNNFFVHHFVNLVSKLYLKPFKEELSLGFDIIDMQYLTYRDNDFYVDHIDASAVNNRALTCLLMLNDDFDGGELCVNDPYGDTTKTIQPKSGRCTIFPSNFMFPHNVRPVTRGVRYTIVAWFA